MSTVIAFVRVFSYLLTLAGAIAVSHAVVGWYMVVSGAVQPGEPMFLDELAPSTGEAFEAVAFGMVLIVIASFLRRLKASRSENEYESPSTS